MAPMHIAIVSHHRLPVTGYGGTERVVVALVRGLAQLGHRVTLIAPPGTRVPEAGVVEIAAKLLRDRRVNFTKAIPSDADIVHAHFPVLDADATGAGGPPLVQTAHGNWKPGKPVPPRTIFLSRDHARRHKSEAFVYNGLDPSDFFMRRRKESWDLFLGQLHSAKGYQWAIEAAKRTGHSLIVAGGWRPTFSHVVKYVGEVDNGQKRALLARARCLWNPVLWDEPFGLVSIEALFSGTPVIGTTRGALPEIITPEVGALRDTLEELLVASVGIHRCDPEACRARAEQCFSHLAMAAGYVRMYEHVVKTGALPAGLPLPGRNPPPAA